MTSRRNGNGIGESRDVWHIGGPIDRVKVSFILYGDELDPEVITSRLGVKPTRAHRKGEPRPGTRRAAPRIGMWALESALPRSDELEQHLRHLLDILDPVSAELLTVIREGCEPTFSCGCFLDAFNRGAELTGETLGKIGALGAKLRLDIYCCEEPGGDSSSDA